MKKIISFLGVLFLILIIHKDALATNRVFLLDTSGSMRKEGLFEKIKETLKRDYVSKMKPGEHIIILTFDEKVTVFIDQEIKNENDISSVNKQIDNLKAIGPWTWMTKGLQLTIEQAKRLKTQFPDEGLNIYFLTDGVNDPPPQVNEPLLKFIEVLLNYFKEFKMEDAYVYVLLYKENGESQTIPKEDKEKLEKETDGKVTIDTRAPGMADPIPAEIRIGYSGFDFGRINVSRGDVEKNVSIGIKEIRGDAKGKIVQLSVGADISPKIDSIKISPDNFQIQNEGQTEKVTIYIHRELSNGDYVPFLKLSSPDNVLISPNKIQIKFSAKTSDISTVGVPFNWEWVWKPLILFMVLAILYFLLLLLRLKNLWVQKEGKEDRYQVRVKNMKKSSLELIDLPNYFIGFGIFPPEVMSVFLFNGEEREGKIIVGKSVICKSSDGREITITFYNKPSPLQSQTTESTMITDEKQHDPDFFRKKDEEIIDFRSDKHKGDIR